MLKNIYLFKRLSSKIDKSLYVRHFSILERYIRARPHSKELKISEDGVNEEIKEEYKKKESTYYPPNITRGVIPKSAYMNIWEVPKQPENPKFLKIALIGAPNAGKSSLLNSILNKTISAVSPKINTTRHDIKGIYTKDNVQLIFIDAPGVIPSHKKKKFCKELVSYAWKGYEEADLVLFVVDTVKRPTSDIFSIVRILAPKKVDTYNSESESDDESNEYDEEYNTKQENFNKSNINNDNYKERNTEGDEKKKNNRNNTTSSSQPYEGTLLKEKEDNKKVEEKFIKYFLKKMQNDSKYTDKSIKENLFENRKKIIESYYDTKNNHKNEKKIMPPVILVLNKVDLCTHNKWANSRAKEFMNNGDFDNIFFISAKYNKGIEELLDYIIKYKAKNQLWIYPKDTSTTLTKVQVVEQLINTYLYCWFNKDVPYKIKHHMLSWCVNLNNCLIIEYQIIVKSEKVAKMICGVHNKLIINMRKNVSYKLTKLWGKNVYVHIHVKCANF